MIDWNEIRTFAAMVDGAWERAGRPAVRLTSWYRDEAHNRRVGGDPRSQHLLALAIDIAPDRAGHALAEAARGAGLIVLDEGDHFHIQRYARGRTPGYLYA